MPSAAAADQRWRSGLGSAPIGSVQPQFGPYRPRIGRDWLGSDQFGLNLVRIDLGPALDRLVLARIRSVRAQFGPDRPRSGLGSAEIGSDRIGSGSIWSGSASVRSRIGWDWLGSDRFGLSLVRIGLGSARIST